MNKVAATAAAVVLVLLIRHARNNASVEGATAIPETWPEIKLWQHDGEYNGIVKTYDNKGVLSGTYLVGSDGLLYVRPPDKDANVGKATYTAVYSIIDTSGTDLGCWAGYCRTERASSFQTGLRWAPIRLFECLSPDIVVGREVAGAGCSLYAPRRFVGSTLSHLGLGAWYCAPYRGGSPSLCLGLSFSTK